MDILFFSDSKYASECDCEGTEAALTGDFVDLVEEFALDLLEHVVLVNLRVVAGRLRRRGGDGHRGGSHSEGGGAGRLGGRRLGLFEEGELHGQRLGAASPKTTQWEDRRGHQAVTGVTIVRAGKT